MCKVPYTEMWSASRAWRSPRVYDSTAVDMRVLRERCHLISFSNQRKNIFKLLIPVVVLLRSQYCQLELDSWSRSQTRIIPTATHAAALATATPAMIAIAGSGSFRRAGVRPWYAIARLEMIFRSSMTAESILKLNWLLIARILDEPVYQ